MTVSKIMEVLKCGDSKGSALKDLAQFYHCDDYDLSPISDAMADSWLRRQKSVKQVQEFGKRGVYTGEEREMTETLGYYSSLAGLLRAVVRDAARRGIEEGKITTIRQYLDELAEMEKKLTEITMEH